MTGTLESGEQVALTEEVRNAGLAHRRAADRRPERRRRAERHPTRIGLRSPQPGRGGLLHPGLRGRAGQRVPPAASTRPPAWTSPPAPPCPRRTRSRCCWPPVSQALCSRSHAAGAQVPLPIPDDSGDRGHLDVVRSAAGAHQGPRGATRRHGGQSRDRARLRGRRGDRPDRTGTQ